MSTADRFSRRPALLATLALLAFLLLAAPTHAAWPGRGGPVVYAGLDPGQRPYPFVPAGLRGLGFRSLGPQTQITTDPSDLDPQISPDGRLIVFSRTVRTVRERPISGIFVIGRDGSGGLRQLTDGGPRDDGDVEPTFYPSGDRIAFVRSGDIYFVRLDGTGLRAVSSSYIGESAPAISPDGRQIAFMCTGMSRQGIDDSDRHICSIRPDGSRLRDLTPRFEGGQEAFDPDFSPSGRTIAFGLGPGTASDVFTMRRNGTRIAALTNRSPGGRRIFPRDVGYAEPSFSPAGDSIVAVARPGAGPHLVRIRLGDPDSPQRLGRFAGRAPAWAPVP